MIRLILAFIGLLAVLLWALVHGIGGAMWDLADGQELWWNGEERRTDD